MKKIMVILALATISMAFFMGHNDSEIKSGGGIKFLNISLEKAKELAEKSDKIIFIDAHTSWCGPCKKMAATSFQDQEVSKAFNAKYINLKVDIENDADGQEIARMYKVQAYPTLLFINSKGKLIKTLVGFQSADKLVAVASSMK
jgi:thiol:disulfide interchange protein